MLFPLIRAAGRDESIVHLRRPHNEIFHASPSDYTDYRPP